MSNEINRYDSGLGMEERVDGQYVLHSDHEAVVDSMTAALVKLDGACLASEQEVARLRAEVEQLHAKLDRKEGQRKLAESECAAMRKDAERYRWLRDHPWRDNEQLEPVIRLHLNALWDDKIDAAMGASA
ncbi:TPA: hypothetical protein QEL68_000746 [Stenotrophomonas maltophilia]|nr:hypothetical protein [Stenotrophomonas maltophilia]